jgi:putative transposase
VIKDAAGRYFASFVVETELNALPAVDSVVGIDLGLGHFAVLSDGTKVSSPRFLRRAEKKLKREQRSLSRKVKGSRNREKARVKLAVLMRRWLMHGVSSTTSCPHASSARTKRWLWRAWR